MHDPDTTILKRDAMGRIGYPPDQREALLDEFERSGLKGAAFARTVGISYPTFANWIQKRRHARGDYEAWATPGRTAARQGPRWLEAVGPAVAATPDPCVPATASAPLAVVLLCGARLLVEDARQATLAAQVLRAVQSLTAPRPC